MSAPLRVRDLTKSRAPLFIYLIFISLVMVRFKVRVRVSCRVRVRFNNSHMSHKSHTASYLAMRRSWHDTGHFCRSALIQQYQ